MIPLADLGVLLWPFIACLMLVGILGYLGIHVLARKVIFVDLAMAQIAALGAAAAMLNGYEPGDPATYVLSLIFTLAGAAVFAVTRTHEEKVPHEAIIGLVYAIASAAGILLADLSPHGAEEMKGLLQGSIVWVTPRQLLPAAGAIAAVAVLQFVFRRRFLLLSFDPAAARAAGINVRLWDFVFYLSFGFVITSSVPIAGVLLVFCFLIAPAVAASMFASGLRARLLVGWLVGAVVSGVGLLFSYDRPSGPTILCTFALFLAVVGTGVAIRNSGQRLRATGLAVGAVAFIVVSVWLGSRLLEHAPGGIASGPGDVASPPGALVPGAPVPGALVPGALLPGAVLPDAPVAPVSANPLAALTDPQPDVRRRAAEDLGAQGRREAVPELIRLLADRDAGVREAAAGALAALHAKASIPDLERSLALPADGDWTPLALALALAELGARSGVEALLHLAREGDAKKVREAASRRLRRLLPAEAGVPEDPLAPVDTTAAWWKANAASVVFDDARGVFTGRAAP